MSTPDLGRATFTARLRQMADWLDAHPDVPVSPYATPVIHYFADDPSWINAVQHAALDTHFTRDASDGSDMLIYRVGDRGPWAVEYRVYLAKPKCGLCGAPVNPDGSCAKSCAGVGDG